MVDALGVEAPLDGDEGVDGEAPPGGVVAVVLDPVAFAAAWKASKDFAAVGLMAKTIP